MGTSKAEKCKKESTGLEIFLPKWRMKLGITNIQVQTISQKWKSYLPNELVVDDLYSSDAIHTHIGKQMGTNFLHYNQLIVPWYLVNM